MKKRFIDPFFPNRPVKDPNLFEGRIEQIDEIVDALFQTKNHNPKHFIITGDRGIGKSSLLLQTKILSEGDNSLATRYNLDLGCKSFDFLSSWTDVTDGQTLENLAKCLLTDLESIVKKIFTSLKFSIDLISFFVTFTMFSNRSTLYFNLFLFSFSSFNFCSVLSLFNFL